MPTTAQVPSPDPARAPEVAAEPEADAFPDFRFAPNIGRHADVYESENRAFLEAGHVLEAMRQLAPWAGRELLDLGCGTGFWLAEYARDASLVIGVEPDPALRAAAARRVGGQAGIEVLAGSAEHLPLPDDCIDLVHARFAYFFPPGTDAGLTEVLRVLRPGGRLVVVDNDYRWGEFATLLAGSAANPPQLTAAETDRWWASRAATRHAVRSELQFRSRAELEAVLQIEFPGEAADAWLSRNPLATGLSYGYVLFAVAAASRVTGS